MGTHQQPTLFDMTPDPWLLDEDQDQQIARVVFTRGAEGIFDYRIPDILRPALVVGKRVRVPWGRSNRGVEAYCVEIVTRSAHAGKLKIVESVLDAQPLASPAILALTRWMSDYYLAPWGRVLEGVVPAGVRHRSGTREVTLLAAAPIDSRQADSLRLTSKQMEILEVSRRKGPLTPKQLAHNAGCTSAPISALRKKGLLIATKERVQSEWDQAPSTEVDQTHTLNAAQTAAMEMLEPGVLGGKREVYLLHGVTGSGKTEVYMRMIQHVVAAGRQAIVLVPEISLTPQTCRRFRARFQRIAVLHSHLTDSERHWHWQQIASGAIQVVVGARSAVFAPAPQLGLIVIDEEHDASFKQDTIPRYHARDVALKRAEIEGFSVILGTATPSLESWHHAHTGRYQLVPMPVRIRDLALPPVDLVDLRDRIFDKQRKGEISRPLERQIRHALTEGGQVILLLNRRGYSTHIQCPACGMVMRCTACDIALTDHRDLGIASCHYCDFHCPAPTHCPQCRFEGIRYSGTGTQRLEAEVRVRFPQYSCLRMDSDSMQRPGSHEDAFSRFRSGEIRILVGTQMIAKGLDFPNVTLVGVINADTALHLPDFRASERTFQLITQVAGRTGRGERGGRVVVQSFQPDHPAVVAAATHNYEQFAARELPMRQPYGYPPFGAMIRVILRGESESATFQFAETWVSSLRRETEGSPVPIRILGPAPAPIARLRGLFRFHALLQSADGSALRDATQKSLANLTTPPTIQWVVDVDPYDML